MSISIQTEDFDLAREYEGLRQDAGDPGAIVTFTGLVREIYDANAEPGPENRILSLTLEHYPGMTEKSLQQILDNARQRWDLLACRIIHRVGKLQPHEQIVFVGAASSHRQHAFEAASYLMDYLKSTAPFWKKQETPVDSHWVQARESDAEAIARWQASHSGD
jgi:molybdopterin synthase catalytic subunit